MDDLAETVGTYEAVADEYEDRHGDDRGPVREQLERFVAALDGDRVLDVGCGPGWETAALAAGGHEVVAVDLAEEFAAKAHDRAPDAGVARMDMRALGFPEDAFDGLWVMASFLHVPREEAPATLRGFRRVLRPGGALWLSVKSGDGEGTGDAYEADRRRFVYYRTDELRDLLADAGFAVVETERPDTGKGDWVVTLARA